MDIKSLEAIADMICGDNPDKYPVYRSSSKLTNFFHSIGLGRFRHDGSTRKLWVFNALQQCSPQEISTIILRLASPKEYQGNQQNTRKALVAINELLAVEGFRVEINGVEPCLEKIKVSSFNFDKELLENEILKPLPPPNFLTLKLEPGIGELLEKRWQETQICVDREAYLAAIIMMGSLLEGLFLAVLQANPSQANQYQSTPKDKTGKVKNFADWKLSEMIDVAHGIGWIGLDVKRFSHVLREFRNLIHPYEQMLNRANPDADTCKISWLVVQATTNDLAKVLQNSRR